MEINTDNVNIDDKFSTENKLLYAVGCPNVKGDTRLAVLKDVKRHLDYAKTGKLYRGKETNEIVITAKYSQPIERQDGRTSEIIKYLKSLIILIPNKSIGNKKLFIEELKIVDEELWNKSKGNNVIEFYKYYLLNDFKGKVNTSLNQMYRENDWFYFSHDYLLINNQHKTYDLATTSQSEYIESMRANIKNKIIAKYKFEHPREKTKTWKNLAYRYTNTFYKLVNQECKETLNVDKCVNVVTINKNSENNPYICETILALNEVKLYYKLKMEEWIIKHKHNKNEDVIKFHNELFEDVKRNNPLRI